MQNGDHVWTWNYKTQDATVCMNHAETRKHGYKIKKDIPCPKVTDFWGQLFWATVCTRVAADRWATVWPQ